MKALHIISGDLWAGAEVQAYTLLKSLKNDIAVTAIILNDQTLYQKLKEVGIDTILIEEKQYSSFYIFLEIKRLIKRIKPNVIHTHRLKENIIGSLANFLSIRAKCVRTVHGNPEFTPTLKQRILRYADKFCGLYMQDNIIAVSDDLQLLLADRFGEDKVTTIANGIEPVAPDKNCPKPEFKQERPNSIHVGLAGRLEAIKRVDIFIKMAALLINGGRDTQWQFHIFGEGSLLPDLCSQAQELNISENVNFHGHTTDILNNIAALDFLVICSDHEGMPMNALEGISLNTKVIAHAIGGLPELFKEMPEWLCYDHSSEGYAQKITEAIENQYPSPYLPSRYLARNNARGVLRLYNSLVNS